MIILGINAYHPDSSACLLIDGEIKIAIEEERINRIKHWSGLPILAIKHCLHDQKISIKDVDLISGLIKPCKGSILIDNTIELYKVKKSWIEKISYVQQNIFLFNSTIKANIICEDEKNYSIEKYNNLKKIMPIDEIFSRFPNGLDTVVGKDGINLSGGQKQLISIARALYKDSEIIIFDEANSALDKEYTEVLEKIIFELKGKKTIIFVTHDMLLLKKSFDKIYKLHSGEIILQ